MFKAPLLTSALLLLALPVSALTPESTSEYFSAPSGLIGARPRVHAVQIKTADGPFGAVRVRMLVKQDGVVFFLTPDQARTMLKHSVAFEQAQAEAKASPADMFDKRVGINDGFDLVYRLEKNPADESFWVVPAGGQDASVGMIMDRNQFKALIQSLEVVIAKIPKGT